MKRFRVFLVVLCCGLSGGVHSSVAYRQLRSAPLRFIAEIPDSWTALSGDSDIVPRTQPDSKHPMGIHIELRQDTNGDPATYLKRKTELDAGQSSSQNIRRRIATIVRERGSWSYVETTDTDSNPNALHTIHAARAAPGGLYIAALFAREPWFGRSKSDFEHFLDTFKPNPPLIQYVTYRGPEKTFEVQFPQGWAVAASAQEGVIRFINPGTSDGETAESFVIRKFSNGGLYRDGAAYLNAEARTTPSHNAGRIHAVRLPAGEARTFEIAAEMDMKAMPELAGLNKKSNLRIAETVLQRGNEFYVLSFQASPTAYNDFLPAYQKLLSSFHLLR